MLSILANKLIQRGGDVMRGDIKEVSLVLASANPGAFIESVNLAHGDGFTISEDEAIIRSGEELDFGDLIQHADESISDAGETKEEEQMAPQLQHAEATEDEETVEDVLGTLSDKQRKVVEFVVGAAVQDERDNNSGGDTVKHSEIETDQLIHEYKEGFTAAMNAFEQNGTLGGAASQQRPTLTHSQLETIVKDGPKFGSIKESFLAHAEEYGIENIDLLFPDAKTDSNGISWIKRRTEWVANVFANVHRSPFSRVKSLSADITADEARAKGYVKGTMKKDEVLKLLKRVTTPKTIYKKQKLDRDDIVDITEVDIITWLKGEMRLMLDEEIASAILVGDGREPDDEDKIDEDHLRPIAFDVDMYNTTIELSANPEPADIVEQIVRARKHYKGTGTPTFYTTDDVLTDLILDKDTLGRRFYATEAELAAALRVKEIIVVETMERVPDIVGIIVNLTDYQVGADKGGEINTFDDFDIDYNQQKYLIETRISGALTKPKAAVTIKYNQGNVVTPNAPTFVSGTGVVTIPSQTGVVYKNDDTNATLTAGAQTALAAGATLNVQAAPAAGYSFPHGGDYDWAFTRPLS
jgi:hypothetical protein